jgi:hypothetical protein
MTPRAARRRALLSGLAIFLAVAFAVPLHAQAPADEGGAAAPSTADANNPLAKVQAFNLHDYYVPTMSQAPDQTANTFWLRYAQPFGKWLVRASLPLSRVPAADGTSSSGTSGLGDFNAFAAYLFDTKPGVSFGVGPQITAPTATEDQTGTGKWQGGLAAIYFDATSPSVQWGGLVTWQADFAGDAARAGTNVLAVQPFYFVQLGKGLYVRSTAVMAFNLETDSYNVPVGLGLGKVVPTSGAVFNVFVEPQFTILSRGAGQPELQIFVGFNTQFVKK